MRMTDEELEALYKHAEKRLAALNLDADLIEDQSGQTSAEEHLTWLATADEREILEWAAEMVN